MMNILKKIINYFRRPKCPNDYHCFYCPYGELLCNRGSGRKRVVVVCKIDAR